MTQNEAVNYLAKAMAEVLEYEFYTSQNDAQPMAEAMTVITGDTWEIVRTEYSGGLQYVVRRK